MTGGDKITARFLYGSWFDFFPTHKTFIATNHKPLVKGTDEGIWRRINLIPFTVRIPEAERNKHMLDVLRAELPGVLNWALKGCSDWRKNGGLRIPKAVRGATARYRTEMRDHIERYLRERCILDAAEKASAAALYEDYSSWCEEADLEPETQKSFGKRLTEKGLTRGRTAKGIVYEGISLR
jgi:putative DNA primase/helicase